MNQQLDIDDLEDASPEELAAYRSAIEEELAERTTEQYDTDFHSDGETNWMLIEDDWDVKVLASGPAASAINDTKWSETHATWVGHKNAADKGLSFEADVFEPDGPFEPDSNGWIGVMFDHSARAAGAVNDAIDGRIPEALDPTAGDGPNLTVVLEREAGRNLVTVNVERNGNRYNPTMEVNDLLESELSYEHPDKEHIDSYRSGRWDGRINIYNNDDYGRYAAPLGLTTKIREILEDEGYEVEIEGDQFGNVGADTSDIVSWESPFDPRQYQREAIDELLAAKHGLIGLPTGSGKTFTALKAIEEIGRRAIVFVHTVELLEQWADEIRESLGVEPTLIGDGRIEEGDGAITVCIMQTLVSRGLDVIPEMDFGVVVFDEAHTTSAADEMHAIAQAFDAQYRIGLSATPWRRIDGQELKIEGAVGELVYSQQANELIDDGYLSELKVEKLYYPGDCPSSGDYARDRRKCIVYNGQRNQAIAERALDMAKDGRSVIVNCAERAPCVGGEHDEGDSEIGIPARANEVAERDGLDIETAGIVSNTSDREELLDRFSDPDDDLQVIVSTLLQEGVDIPACDGIVMAQARKSDTETIQVVGRALRPEGNEVALIVDVQDGGRFTQMDRHRLSTYKDYYGDSMSMYTEDRS